MSNQQPFETFDSPKVVLPVRNLLGDGYETVELQSNRVHPLSEFAWYTLNRIAIPARPGCMFADSLIWVSTVALVARLLRVTVIIGFPALVLITLVLPFVALTIYSGLLTVQLVPQAKILITYRATLVIAGLIFAFL